MTTDLAVPRVHLNGTSAQGLMDDYAKALDALATAKAALQQTAPHMRDYYVQDGAEVAFTKARGEHVLRLAHLEQVEDELAALHAAVYKQSLARKH